MGIATRTTGALALVSAMVFSMVGQCATRDTTEENSDRAAWALVWADEFDGEAGTAPDASRWRFETGGEGWGNEELQYYTSDRDNAALTGAGELAITARRSTGRTCWYGPCEYTSARLVTDRTFTQRYGRFEARMKVPAGSGMWPAFWMLGEEKDCRGWPDCGEIDVVENVGSEPAVVHGTVHGPGYFNENGIGGKTGTADGTPLADSFHTYAVEWRPNSIRWFLDDREYFALTPDNLPSGRKWVFDHPFYLLLNLAVGGTWPGKPEASTDFPRALLVDHVRVYRG